MLKSKIAYPTLRSRAGPGVEIARLGTASLENARPDKRSRQGTVLLKNPKTSVPIELLYIIRTAQSQRIRAACTNIRIVRESVTSSLVLESRVFAKAWAAIWARNWTQMLEIAIRKRATLL